MDINKKIIATLSFAALLSGCGNAGRTITNTLRAPAYPLITIDPYTNGWSVTDKLYESNIQHWTGREFPLMGALRVDGELYRFMGVETAEYTNIAGMSQENPWQASYTFEEPSEEWFATGFDDSSWKRGKGAFGTSEDMSVGTLWENKDIWVRRTIELTPGQISGLLYLKYVHDDLVDIYINGRQVVRQGFEHRREMVIPIPEDVLQAAPDGKIVIAAHCDNTGGFALLDFGIYSAPSAKENFANHAIQKSVDVQATRTDYTFDCGPVELKLSFLAPFLPDDLELISRPVNYISYDIRSTDGDAHDVQIYFEASPAWALNHPKQPSTSETYEKDGLMFLKTGSKEQEILARAGDDVRIDWGYFYLAAEKAGTTTSVGDRNVLRECFASSGDLDGNGNAGDMANMALVRSLGSTSGSSGKVMIGYDDIYSIQYFGDNLRPYWNRNGEITIEKIFAEASCTHAMLKEKCGEFDLKLMKEAAEAGGREYAELCALAYRQAISAHKLVEAPNGNLLWLSKENFSNGSIGTVDITYPSAPLFLVYNPELVKGMLNHIFYYSESGKWAKPFPAHDVGTYPLANGQTYGGDMPVEESGNMLILTAAIAAMEGNAAYAEGHWDVLTLWADYLAENGLDPVNQLCTDDFAGHFAHNVNLSAKAIMGIASYARCAEMLGKAGVAGEYMDKARKMAVWWMQNADDGDHYSLTFDKPGTWSQKYNIVWDRLLGFNIFPESVAQTEISYYLAKQNRYGLPLDNRRNYTKADWITWTATLAKDRATFEKFISPVWKFMNETTDRIPMTDWYNTDSPTHVGFRARSVVGGYWIKLLEEKMTDKSR